MLRVRSYQASDLAKVVALWKLTFPDEPDWNESESLIVQKLTTQPELFFVCEINGEIVGTTIAGYDGVRGWVHKVSSHPEHRGQGIAQALMQEAESALAKLGCTKLNIQVRDGNDLALGFYEKIGYSIEARVSLGKRLSEPSDHQTK